MSTFYRYLRHSDSVEDQPNSRAAQNYIINIWVENERATNPEFAAMIDAGEFWDADTSGNIEFFKRPAGAIIRNRLKPGDVIVSAKWDRMFRNSRDYENTCYFLEGKGVRLVCLDMDVDTSTADGAFTASIIVAVSQRERRKASERIKDALKVIKYTKGVKIAHDAPLGWKFTRTHEKTRKDGKRYARLEPDPDERDECRTIARLIDNKGMAYGDVAKMFMLNNRKNPRAKGGQASWSRASVRNRYRAYKAGFPCGDLDLVDGKCREQLMIPVQVPAQ